MFHIIDTGGGSSIIIVDICVYTSILIIGVIHHVCLFLHVWGVICPPPRVADSSYNG
jgi:hypothetical protein